MMTKLELQQFFLKNDFMPFLLDHGYDAKGIAAYYESISKRLDTKNFNIPSWFGSYPIEMFPEILEIFSDDKT